MRALGQSRGWSGTKVVLSLLGAVSCTGYVAFALAPVGSSSDAKASRQPLAIRATPAKRTVAPGTIARFSVRLRHPEVRVHSRNSRKARLRLLSGLPHGARVSFHPPSLLLHPRSLRRNRSRMRVATGTAAGGRYRLKVRARTSKHHADAVIHLVIQRPQLANFTIGGDLSEPLVPGLALPLDLALTNPDPVPIRVSRLHVGIAAVDAPEASASFPCTAGDFSITQFAGAYGFTLPPSGTNSLSQLGFPPAELPYVAMLNTPVNQDGCKGASLSFKFTGAADDS
jgi:hypothetical protein